MWNVVPIGTLTFPEVLREFHVPKEPEGTRTIESRKEPRYWTMKPQSIPTPQQRVGTWWLLMEMEYTTIHPLALWPWINVNIYDYHFKGDEHPSIPDSFDPFNNNCLFFPSQMLQPLETLRSSSTCHWLVGLQVIKEFFYRHRKKPWQDFMTS